MPKCQLHFPSEMLEHEWFKHWIREKWHVAICSYCSKDVSVANMEEAVLMSHIKGKKHIERSPADQCIKLLMLTPALPLI